MVISTLKIMAFILMSTLFPSTKPTEEEDSILLRQVEIPENSQILKILNETLSENKSNNHKIKYFTLDISNDKDVIDITIVAHTKEKLFHWNGYTGYLVLDSIPIIITNESNLKIKLSNLQNRYFPMDSPDDPPYFYDPQEWFFLIKNNDVARYVYSIGWIWDKPNKKGEKQTDSSFRLTRPRRKSKK